MRNLNLKRVLLTTLLTMSMLWLPSINHAQQTTEQFIPIGMSPGISKEHSYMGNVTSFDKAAKTLKMQSNRGTKTIKLSPSTRIWLDRSKAGKSNIDGSIDDLKAGRSVEVMYSGDDHDMADWIKIESS